MMEKKMVKIFGWLLVAYSVYSFFYPIIYIIVEAVRHNFLEYESPIGGYQILRVMGVNSFLIVLLTIFAYIQLFSSLCSLIGGIGILNLKSWARKLIVLVYGISVVSFLSVLPAIIMNKQLNQYMLSRQFSFLHHLFFFIFEVMVIFCFIRPKVKEQFK